MRRPRPRPPEPDQPVGRRNQSLSALDADRLDLVIGVTQPGSVGQQDRQPAQGQRNLDMVARGSRNVGDDRALLPSYRIDQTGFSGVWWTRDNDPNAVLQCLDTRPCRPFPQLFRKACAIASQGWIDG